MAAVDYFMKIEPLKGESKDDKYKDHIDILSWNIGMQQMGHAHTGGGAGAGKVQVGDLHFTHYVDKASPDLMFSCCNGKHFKEVWVICRKAGEKPLEFLKLKFETVLVTSVQNGGHSGEERPVENVTLNFAKMQWEYKEQKEDGSAGPSAKKGWSIVEGKEHS